MKRNQTVVTCALGALAAATLSFGLAAPQQTDPEIAALKTRIDELESTVESLQTFVNAQADAGASLVDALARCEAEGFTAGINPRSREILLEGLRASGEAMQAGKQDEKEGDDEKKSTRGRRRGQ